MLDSSHPVRPCHLPAAAAGARGPSGEAQCHAVPQFWGGAPGLSMALCHSSPFTQCHYVLFYAINISNWLTPHFGVERATYLKFSPGVILSHFCHFCHFDHFRYLGAFFFWTFFLDHCWSVFVFFGYFWLLWLVLLANGVGCFSVDSDCPCPLRANFWPFSDHTTSQIPMKIPKTTFSPCSGVATAATCFQLSSRPTDRGNILRVACRMRAFVDVLPMPWNTAGQSWALGSQMCRTRRTVKNPGISAQIFLWFACAWLSLKALKEGEPSGMRTCAFCAFSLKMAINLWLNAKRPFSAAQKTRKWAFFQCAQDRHLLTLNLFCTFNPCPIFAMAINSGHYLSQGAIPVPGGGLFLLLGQHLQSTGPHHRRHPSPLPCRTAFRDVFQPWRTTPGTVSCWHQSNISLVYWGRHRSHWNSKIKEQNRRETRKISKNKKIEKWTETKMKSFNSVWMKNNQIDKIKK